VAGHSPVKPALLNDDPHLAADCFMASDD
jgi:hypothetical protein